jgi:hypothetical protein
LAGTNEVITAKMVLSNYTICDIAVNRAVMHASIAGKVGMLEMLFEEKGSIITQETKDASLVYAMVVMCKQQVK